MALIDRALQKAYRRPTHDAPAARAHAPQAGERGWVEGLRAPRACDSEQIADSQQEAATVPEWNWPQICQSILDSHALAGLQHFAEQLRLRCRTHGPGIVLFSGPGTGAGRSSLVLAVARLLCNQPDLRLLVADMNLGHPDLAALLGATSSHGPTEMAAGARPLSEALVPLIPERFSLLPYETISEVSGVEAVSSQRIGDVLRECRSLFDLVLVDAGAWETSGQTVAWGCEPRDALVWVTRAGDAVPHSTSCDESPLPGTGLEMLGIIETFVPAARPQTLPSSALCRS